jgi:hypothetical protein
MQPPNLVNAQWTVPQQSRTGAEPNATSHTVGEGCNGTHAGAVLAEAGSGITPQLVPTVSSSVKEDEKRRLERKAENEVTHVRPSKNWSHGMRFNNLTIGNTPISVLISTQSLKRLSEEGGFYNHPFWIGNGGALGDRTVATMSMLPTDNLPMQRAAHYVAITTMYGASGAHVIADSGYDGIGMSLAGAVTEALGIPRPMVKQVADRLATSAHAVIGCCKTVLHISNNQETDSISGMAKLIAGPDSDTPFAKAGRLVAALSAAATGESADDERASALAGYNAAPLVAAAITVAFGRPAFVDVLMPHTTTSKLRVEPVQTMALVAAGICHHDWLGEATQEPVCLIRSETGFYAISPISRLLRRSNANWQTDAAPFLARVNDAKSLRLLLGKAYSTLLLYNTSPECKRMPWEIPGVAVRPTAASDIYKILPAADNTIAGAFMMGINDTDAANDAYERCQPNSMPAYELHG